MTVSSIARLYTASELACHGLIKAFAGLADYLSMNKKINIEQIGPVIVLVIIGITCLYSQQIGQALSDSDSFFSAFKIVFCP